MDRISSREPTGKWALVACIGALLSVCVLASLDWRSPIDYRGPAKTKAFEANARHDSRYLESRSRPLLRPLLPPGLDFDPSETLQLGRDIRLVPAADDDARAARLQHDYLMQYNGEIWRLRAQAGYPRRPAPLSKPMTMMVCALAMLPLMANLYIYYDQLGSAYSDQPDAPELWEIPRFVDEVEQVRRALKLDKSNFYLYGQSWGGILALEYALRYQQNLKGLIISNMVASIPEYNRYANSVLIPAMDPKVVAEIRGLEAAGKFDDPYYDELLSGFYSDHILRFPLAEWPEPAVRSFSKLNKKIYTPMQGPSEMGASGKLVSWDRTADLPRITVPTLAIGARYDTMEPAQMERIARTVKKGRYLYCPNGSHLALYDDQKVYMSGLIRFIRDVDAGRF